MECHGERRGESLADWYHRAARHVESIDDDHLVGTGMRGATGDTYESWNVRNAYVETHHSDAIDVCSFHDYPISRWQGETTVRDRDDFAHYVRNHVEKAHQTVGKPAYFGEFGAVVDPDADLTVAQHDRFFRTATRVARDTGLDGLHVWMPELATANGKPRTRENDPLAIFPRDHSTWQILEAYRDSLG